MDSIWDQNKKLSTAVSDLRPRKMTLAAVAAIKVRATKHHDEIKRMNALKSKAKSRKASNGVSRA